MPLQGDVADASRPTTTSAGSSQNSSGCTLSPSRLCSSSTLYSVEEAHFGHLYLQSHLSQKEVSTSMIRANLGPCIQGLNSFMTKTSWPKDIINMKERGDTEERGLEKAVKGLVENKLKSDRKAAVFDSASCSETPHVSSTSGDPEGDIADAFIDAHKLQQNMYRS